MKFAVKLSIVVAIAVFVIGIYQVNTTKAEFPQVVHEQEITATTTQDSQPQVPPQPQSQPVSQPQPQPKAVPGVPVRLSIPSASIETPVVPVGLNDKGEMDVPSGSTNNVGWYSAGTKPGAVGSAVLDAHVFAALKDLYKVQVGDDIYIDTAAGGTLHFRVESTALYALADVPDDLLFNRADTARLNLITCAGTYVPSINTYDHRLVVYAVLVQ